MSVIYQIVCIFHGKSIGGDDIFQKSKKLQNSVTGAEPENSKKAPFAACRA